MNPATYVRLSADEFGSSRFEDCQRDFASGFAVPPAEPLHTAPFLSGDGTSFWIGAPTDWNGTAMHPAPRRMLFVTVCGEYEIVTSGGETRKFPAGRVLLIEDTHGHGHSTRVTSSEDTVVFAIGLISSKTE